MLEQTRSTVAGGPDEFMTVHRLRLAGSEVDIGRALAEEARRRYGWRPGTLEPRLGRARNRWFERHWPQHLARMRGAAAFAGVDLDRGDVCVDELKGPIRGGCSAAWWSPQTTEDGHGLLGRNYDFFTTGEQQLFAMLSGQESPAQEPPMASRPCVVTTLPDNGIAATLVSMDELDGCMEGVNEYGVTATLLIADAESTPAPVEATAQVGLSSGQLPRFVLETCRSAVEAREALWDAKQYDLGVPLHYLIADASGDAFVWERGRGGVDHVIEVADGPLCVTNHLLHRHPNPTALPIDNDETMRTFERAATLAKRGAEAPNSGARLREVLDEVSFDRSNEGSYPLRTMWRSVIDVDARTMATRFYLGDDSEGHGRYSPELTFFPR